MERDRKPDGLDERESPESLLRPESLSCPCPKSSSVVFGQVGQDGLDSNTFSDYPTQSGVSRPRSRSPGERD
jgi:hypothetical protein